MPTSPPETRAPITPAHIAELLDKTPVPRLSGDDLHLWLLPFPIGHEALRQTIERLPDAGERASAARRVFAADRLRQMHARGLLRYLLGHYLARDPQGLDFITNDYGKPALSTADRLQFNVSHCQDHILIGLTRRVPVGVDLERIRPLPNWYALAAHCCSAQELNWLAGRPANDQERDFFRLWTAKEAVLKALGTGLASPPERVTISLPDTDSGFAGVAGTSSPWTLFSTCPDADHTFAAAIRTVINRRQIRCFHVASRHLDQ
ncbi:MAG TPA: 4'-phosphopantetheinyl transferase superfamily protein [Accumulibacter sp.]|uniref:4'-phosphopantetheinyl transferase family protein n=1 Tax=Accumulibacter sp. TaxID=2053492 RepID=UPI002D07BF59|nr:4'-phosphopantetheinyl transferase superfamily protein [Accumulibacter sp.]HMW57792.1 4'-phosphopantetheinyl transferase superfamily protein [Accumulibacter sp.]